MAHFSQLLKYQDLLYTWFQRELKIRYKQSFIGGLWAILQPLTMMVIFTVVFSVLARFPTDGIPYPIFSYTALLPWFYLSNSVSYGTPTLVLNMSLVTKIYFPREILPLGSIGAAFFDLLIASVVFLVLMLVYQIPLTFNILWVPLLLLIQTALIIGVVLLLSALNVFYRDIRFIIPLGLQVWMFASPIIYPLSLVPESLLPVYMLNPMAGLIDSYRRVVLQGEPPVYSYLAISTVISLVVFLVGYSYFKRAEPAFADLI
jgi:lipopolysaccharide transport system permease protein